MPTQVITLPLSISNAYLLLGDRPVLVDAGAPKDADRLVAALRQHGITPKDLSLVALTHGHTDHTGAVAAAAGGGAPVAISSTDTPLLQSGVNGVLPPTGPAGVILRPLVRRTTFAGFTPQIQLDGPHRLDDYGVGAEMVPAGGHTPGSYVVLLDDGDAIVGDLIRGGFASGRIRPGHPLRHFFTEDRPGNRAAVQRVLDHNPGPHLRRTRRTLGRDRRPAATRCDHLTQQQRARPRRPADRPARADARYASPGDLNDLDAILDRYSDEETAEIRRILAARRAALVSCLTERSRGSA